MQDQGLRWDDVALFLALYRDEALGPAGKRVGLDPSTMSRRLTALEARLTLTLFDRGREGLRPTAAAERLVAAAEAMEHCAADFARDAEGFEREVEGRVRVTAPPGVADLIVAPHVGELVAKHPRLQVEIDARVAYVDLSRRESDLALRASRPRGGDLVAKKVFTTRTVALGSAAYVRSLGTLKDANDARWVSYGADLASLAGPRWLKKHAPQSAPALLTSSFSAQVQAARAGVGLMLAPEPFARAGELSVARLGVGLARSLAELPADELWLVGHRALRGVPRVAAVWQWLDALFAAAEVEGAGDDPR
jgi:DNA-binding transcriptional LysR family regulator